MKHEQSEGHVRTHTHIHMQATAQRNGAAEHFLIIMKQPAVLAGASEEGRQAKSMSLT